MKVIYMLGLSILPLGDAMCQNLPDVHLGVFGNSYVGGIRREMMSTYGSSAYTFGSGGIYAKFPLGGQHSIVHRFGYSAYGCSLGYDDENEVHHLVREQLQYLESNLALRAGGHPVGFLVGVKTMYLLNATQISEGKREDQTQYFNRIKNYLHLGMEVDCSRRLTFFTQVQTGLKALEKYKTLPSGAEESIQLTSLDLGLRLLLAKIPLVKYYTIK